MADYDANKKIKDLIKTIVANNENLLAIIGEENEPRLLPTKFRLRRAKQIKKIEEEYKEFLKANNEFPVMKSGEDYFVYKNFNVDIDKLKFHAGEECCDLIVSCLTYLHTFFSKEERNKLIEYVNEKNIKRGYLEK